jgi:hypothetical protein
MPSRWHIGWVGEDPRKYVFSIGGKRCSLDARHDNIVGARVDRMHPWFSQKREQVLVIGGLCLR